MPHTLTSAIVYRARLDSLNDLPKEKRPPRNLWDKPHRLNEYIDTIWDKDKGEAKTTGKDYMEFNLEDVE